jgi:hypothetical protein
MPLVSARATGDTGAVTLIQRFGSALNLNVHFHMIFIDGVYLPGDAAICATVFSPRIASSAIRALKAGEWLRRGRLMDYSSPVIVPGQISTYLPVRITEATSLIR